MATKYYWPGAIFNGNGSSGVAATSGGGVGAYNTLTGISISAGDVIRIKRGTKYTDPSPSANSPILVLSLTATAASPTTIEAYYNDDGTDDSSQPRPIIDHNGGGNGQACIRVQSSQYVIVRNIHGINSLLSGGGAVRVRNSSDVLVEDCVASACTYGLTVIQDTAATTISRITLQNNEVYDNICGILFEWMDAANSYIDDLTICNNLVRDNYRTPGGSRAGGIQHGASNLSATVVNPDRGTRGIVIEGNECYGNHSYPISIFGARNSATRNSAIRNNRVYNNNSLGLMDSHPIWLGACSNVIVEDNVIYGNTGFINQNYGSSVSIFVDFSTANTSIIGDSNIIRRNKIYGGWVGSTNVNLGAGAGIYVLNQTNCLVEDNLIYNCMTGIIIARDTPAAPAHIIRNNTICHMIANDIYTGVGILVNVGNNHSIYNNVIMSCDEIGLFINSSLTGVTENNNCIYDCKIEKVISAAFTTQTSSSPDVSDILSNPKLTTDKKPSPDSPLIENGVHITYTYDLQGIQHYNPPSIGAYEYVRARGTRT